MSDAGRGTGPNDAPDSIAGKASQILKLMEQLGRLRATDESADKKPHEHKFWATQPVLSADAALENTNDGPIDKKQSGVIRTETYPIPPEFRWSDIDIDDPGQRDELYQLLNLNYVEDIESLFRFDYPPCFLEWALKAPGWKGAWHVGVRVAETGKLVAFISAIPVHLIVRSSPVTAVEVNFLCVHKRLRAKRLAPLLIREITRRVNLYGIYQALYTAGAVLPGILCKARYHHRPLNYKTLVNVGFTSVPLGKSIDQMMLRYHLAKGHQLGSALRPMIQADVNSVTALLDKYLESFPLRPKLSEEEVRHWLLPRDRIMYSYVLEDGGQVTDFVSFYSLPSTVVNNPLHSRISVAYLFYYAAQSPAYLTKLVHAALVIARDASFDVFNCVEIMHNPCFLKELKFGEGDGYLNYYLYNWQTKPLSSEETAVVML